jgi:hypothetical protein
MTLLPPATLGAILPTDHMPHLRAWLIFATEQTPVPLWPQLIDKVVIDHGASLILPQQGQTWGSHLAELSVFGITGRADTLEGAVRDWVKAAERTLPVAEAA